MTTFLFASVVASGLRVLSYLQFTRRDRFILAAAFSFGMGDLLVPGIFTHLFDGVDNPNSGLQGLFDSITIVLDTPCSSIILRSKAPILTTFHAVLIAGIVAVILNLIIPQEKPEEIQEDIEVEVVDNEANLDPDLKGEKVY